MQSKYMTSLALSCLVPFQVHAETGTAAETSSEEAPKAVSRVNQMTTGVARARDRLDSATSTSTLNGEEIEKLGIRSVSEIFRYIPGMRAESTGGEGFASISIRGLPIALGGAKFLQIQENGLPTLEFGDMAFATADQFLRADLNLAGVQAIRGGSASTFASNSPGGIVNLIDKTGVEAGGAIQFSSGLDYDSKRVDFEYGAPLSENWRFHLGGFYRKGEGPRATGFDGFDGGQIKFNLTRSFAGGGYIRIYGKWLDDKTTPTPYTPVAVSGTGENPNYSNVPGISIKDDTLFSAYIPSHLTLDTNNRIENHAFSDTTHSRVKSVGLESQFDIDEWTVVEKFRYSRTSGRTIWPYTLINGGPLPYQSIAPAQEIMALLRATSLAYATGPSAGQVIADPSALNGNGLLALVLAQDVTLNSLDNFTNDLRVSRVWDAGPGKLTFTAGFYKSSQDIDTSWAWSTMLSDVRGGGEAHLIDAYAGSYPLTQNGVLGYSMLLAGGLRRDRYDLTYDIDAPYGSLNYMFGKFALGASIRYDFGQARGTLYGTSLPGSTVASSVDMNGDGVISLPEMRTGVIPYDNPAPVDYNYKYLSYSISANYRLADDLSLFARYSKGGRAAADRILFANYVSPTSGKLLNKSAAYDPVKQAEGGVKFRTSMFEAYVTGFWAHTREHNIGLDRAYEAYGLEFEGKVSLGIFSMTGGATWTKAEITDDRLDPSTIGNSPKHQADLIFQLVPMIDLERLTMGAGIYGTTSSYTGDLNELKMPGYIAVNGFAQYRASDRVTLMLNGNNLFNALGLVDVNAERIPASGVVTARAINPRTVSAAVRFNF